MDAAERDEASVGDGDISARRILDDLPAEAVPVRIQSQVGRQRGPGPDIIPVELREHGGDGSGALHDGIVHGDFRERGEMFREISGQSVAGGDDDRVAQLPLESGNIVDHGVRRENDAKSIRGRDPGDCRGEGAGGRGVSIGRLRDDMAREDHRQGGPRAIDLGGMGEDKCPFARDDSFEPGDRGFEEGSLSQQAEKMLRSFPAAHRPEALAAAAGFCEHFRTGL